MNVFRLHDDPKIAAKYHADNHVIKMLTEAGQILSHAAEYNGIYEDYMYKVTYDNHPLFEWAADTLGNWRWVYDLAAALAEEKALRHGGTHKTWEQVISRMPREPEVLSGGETRQYFAGPGVLDDGDIVEAYRKLYKRKDNDFGLRYNLGRDRPDWL